MSDNDLSDEALIQWQKENPRRSDYPTHYAELDVAQEWRRRAKANPWQLLTTEQLEAFSWMLTAPETEKITDAVRAELERRKAK